ncbi:MAG: zf-HC2 domain-containing protein [Deltaproteobacteria bacterium]|nr:zf-HC2 domain-containing protein [Deltaproteobacteria bacterium]
MVNCKEAVDLLADFLERKLHPETQTAVEAHMGDCPPCEQFMQSYRKTSTLCKKALLKEAPTELMERLITFLRANARK